MISNLAGAALELQPFGARTVVSRIAVEQRRIIDRCFHEGKFVKILGTVIDDTCILEASGERVILAAFYILGIRQTSGQKHQCQCSDEAYSRHFSVPPNVLRYDLALLGHQFDGHRPIGRRRLVEVRQFHLNHGV